MRIWAALIVSPILALMSQSLAFGVVSWSCAHQRAAPIHVVHLVFLAATVILGVLAWQQGREAAVRLHRGEARPRRRFFAAIATASAIFSSLVIVAMWLPTWMLSPCFA